MIPGVVLEIARLRKQSIYGLERARVETVSDVVLWMRESRLPDGRGVWADLGDGGRRDIGGRLLFARWRLRDAYLDRGGLP